MSQAVTNVTGVHSDEYNGCNIIVMLIFAKNIGTGNK